MFSKKIVGRAKRAVRLSYRNPRRPETSYFPRVGKRAPFPRFAHIIPPRAVPKKQGEGLGRACRALQERRTVLQRRAQVSDVLV